MKNNVNKNNKKEMKLKIEIKVNFFLDFEHFRKNMPFINLLISNVNHIDKLNMFEIKNTIKLLKNLKYVNKKELNEQILDKIKDLNFKVDLLEKIEADHTLSKFLIRNCIYCGCELN